MVRAALPFIAAIALVAAVTAQADELKLKDGTKIVGTIVGFEDSSFRVKTSYGFAVVQRDQVASISVADATKKPESEKKVDPGEKSASGAKQAKPANLAASAAAQTPHTDAKPPANGSAAPLNAANAASAAIPGSPAATNAAPGSTASASASAPKTATAVPAPPLKPVGPEPIREEVAGNAYVNETYGFRMYKPPDWELIAGARTLLPGAITAMGTGDQTTYLLIGQEPAGKSLANDMDSTEQRLRDVMDNFRPLGEKRITVSGGEAVERRFRGSVDQHDWSGTVVLVPRGPRVYTIFGMTYADTDLVQIQENVISRAISSLQFTKQ